MKTIINYVLKVGVILLAAFLFPNNIIVDGIGSAIIVALLISIVGWIVLLVQITLCAIIAAANESLGYLITIIVFCGDLIFFKPICLYIISHKYAGFEIQGGFWCYILLSLVLGIFTIRDKKKTSK